MRRGDRGAPLVASFVPKKSAADGNGKEKEDNNKRLNKSGLRPQIDLLRHDYGQFHARFAAGAVIGGITMLRRSEADQDNQTERRRQSQPGAEQLEPLSKRFPSLGFANLINKIRSHLPYIRP